MSQRSSLDFIVNKSAWDKTRWVEREVSTDLKPGQVLFRVDRFAFTANNISYAMAGDLLSYWKIFPVLPQEEGWGRLPTMGFGEVIASTYEGVAVGTRCSGFYPMSQHLLIEPASATPNSIVDGVSHRLEIAAVYNQYQPVDADPFYALDREDELMLVRGLFMTSFLAEDFLGDSKAYDDAKSVVISSASSKTSIALAFRVAEKGERKAIGLTSGRNLDFVKSLGFYDQVVTYDEIASIPDSPAVYVDMAGNTAVSRDVHEHLGANLKFSQRIGGTHWDAGGNDKDLPGPKREFFFAPSQIAKRISDWGSAGFQERLGASLRAFIESTDEWLKVVRGYGRDAVENVYDATLEGKADPGVGNVLSLWDDEDAAGGR